MERPEKEPRERESPEEFASRFDRDWWLEALAANETRDPGEPAAAAPDWTLEASELRVGEGPATYALQRLRQSLARVSVIRCAGEVDLATVAPLRRLLDAEIEGGRPNLVVDLSETLFVDSTALCLLIGALKRCRLASGEVRVVCTSARIRQIFNATRLHQLFRIFPSLRTALHAQWV